MWKLGLCLCSIALLASNPAGSQQRAGPPSPAASAAPAWKKHTFPAERFEIEFPGPVRSEPVALDPQTRRKVVRSTLHLMEEARFVYVAAAQQHVEAVNLEAGIRASFGALKCKGSPAETDLPTVGGRGREVRGSDCVDGSMRAEARYFEVGKWFYQVLALFPRDGGDEQAARRFLSSFKAIGN